MTVARRYSPWRILLDHAYPTTLRMTATHCSVDSAFRNSMQLNFHGQRGEFRWCEEKRIAFFCGVDG